METKEEIIKQQERVRELLKERDAILLAHNYQRPEVQDVADMTGDSLGLSIEASKTKAKVIVFCGVDFMAETAYILSPKKTVLIPRADAHCPMAAMIDAESLKKRKKELPGVPVVTYVNTTAEVKAESDICCTSANVVAVVNSLKAKKVLITPDKNLAMFAARHVKTEIIPWEGHCNIHDRMRAEHVLRAKKRYPKAIVLAHPECRPEVLDLADVISSTSGMLDYASESKKDQFIIGTENGILHQLRKRNPDKKFYMLARTMVCPNMKLTRLFNVIRALERMRPEVTVEEKIRIKALKAVNRMLKVPRD